MQSVHAYVIFERCKVYQRSAFLACLHVEGRQSVCYLLLRRRSDAPHEVAETPEFFLGLRWKPVRVFVKIRRGHIENSKFRLKDI